MPLPLLLASTSPYRKNLLGRLRLPFQAVAPGVDEERLRDPTAAPAVVAATLARAKAEAVAGSHPGTVVIGSDQVLAFAGEVLGKPGTPARAIAQLQRLQGHRHELITAVAIVHPGGIVEFADTTRLSMRPLGVAEIERYVAADQPLDCAGAYKIEALGISLFAAIDGEDQTAIVGLPLLRLCTELRRLGFPLP